jgi:hypothetical protein
MKNSVIESAKKIWKAIIPIAYTLIVINLLSGCISEEQSYQIGSLTAASDSVTVRYTGLRDSTKVLLLKIMNSNKYHGIAHFDTVHTVPKQNSCDSSSHKVCISDFWQTKNPGVTGVIYMQDNEIFERFNEIHSWLNDCGHFDVVADFEDRTTFDLMFMYKFEPLVRSAKISPASLDVFNRFILNIKEQELLAPLGCM